jgi:uncharacterized protein
VTVRNLAAAGREGLAVVDCDIHNAPADVEALFPYLDDHWREYIGTSQFKGPTDTAYPPSAATSMRTDATTERGDPPGSTLESVRTGILEPWGSELGILTCAYAADSVRNPDAAAAMASAVNDWQIEQWLEREPRLRASIVVPAASPTLAAREIDRAAGHPGFVQVLLPVRSALPYGNRCYYPLLEAAVRNDLALGLHFGGAPGNPPTASGWPTFYIEEYVGMATAFQSQLLSLVAEGAFDRFPQLRVAVVEGGFAWLPAFLWRFDRAWRALRREVPWTKRLPSAYVRDHVRFTLQPIDGPREPEPFARLLDQLPSEELLMFSTDFPHWQYETPEGALPPGLSEELARKILAENARAFYRLEGGA